MFETVSIVGYKLINVDAFVEGDVSERLPVLRDGVMRYKDELGGNVCIYDTVSRSCAFRFEMRNALRLTFSIAPRGNMTNTSDYVSAFEDIFAGYADETAGTDVGRYERVLSSRDVCVTSSDILR
jgi:hypothetical protein